MLSGTDLTLGAGSLTTIVGSNGSGKSTLLRIAAGVSRPSGGIVQIPESVGFVPERQAGRSGFTAMEYVTHMGRIRGLDSNMARTSGTDLLARLGVWPSPKTRWEELSKGNRQKVILAQAFIGRLDAVILDEPFSGLDHSARNELTILISEARALGASVLLSSHDVMQGVTNSFRIVAGRLESDLPTPSSSSRTQMRRVELTRKNPEASPRDLTRRSEILNWEAVFGG